MKILWMLQQHYLALMMHNTFLYGLQVVYPITFHQKNIRKKEYAGMIKQYFICFRFQSTSQIRSDIRTLGIEDCC